MLPHTGFLCIGYNQIFTIKYGCTRPVTPQNKKNKQKKSMLDIVCCLVREFLGHIGMVLPVIVLLIADAAMPPTNLIPALPPGNKATM